MVQLELGEALHDGAHTIVHALDEGGVNRIGLGIGAGGQLLLVLGDDLRLAGEGRVDRVVGEVDVERSVLVGLDEPERFAGEPVGQEFTGFFVGDVRNPVGRKIAARGAHGAAAEVYVKALLLRIKGLVPEMPLAENSGGVTAILQLLGDGALHQRQMEGPIRNFKLRVRPPVAGDIVGDV